MKTLYYPHKMPPEVVAAFGAPTRWSQVWRAGHGDEESMREAMENICQEYWPPIYAYIRRQGKSVADAQDLTQGFFCEIIRKNWFATADPARGRLRSFLFTSLINFLKDNYRFETAGKRGSGQAAISLPDAEEWYHHQAVDHLTPDRLFQRQWAMVLVERALEAARAEYTQRGQLSLFEALQSRLLDAQGGDEFLSGVAEPLQMSPGAVRTALCRLRSRFRDLLFREVGVTIATSDRDKIREEMTLLLEYL